MPNRDFHIVEQPYLSDVDGWVLRNRNLRTVSGLDGSSTKWNLLCAVRLPGLS
jgi:hypothetical protein